MKIQGACRLLKTLQISKYPWKLTPKCSKHPLLLSIIGRVGNQHPHPIPSSMCLLPWLVWKGESSCSLFPAKAPSPGTPGLCPCMLPLSITSLAAASIQLWDCSAWLCRVALRLHHYHFSLLRGLFPQLQIFIFMLLLKLTSFLVSKVSLMFPSYVLIQFFSLINIEEITSQTCRVLHLNTLLTLVFLPQQLVLCELYKLGLGCASASMVN